MGKRTAVILFSLLAAAASARADVLFTATLTTSQETTGVVLTTSDGAPRPAPFGYASFVLNEALDLLTVVATIHNIDVTGTQTPDANDDLRSAHIHAPAPPGANAGVVWGFFGMPFNDTLPPVMALTPFADGVGGTFAGAWNAAEGNNTSLIAHVPTLLAGLAYINFHTIQNPAGEIRGQVRVPEPGTASLAVAALLVLLLRRRGPPPRLPEVV